MDKKTVYIVHAIDTEGPLYESLSATFERLKTIIGVDLEPTQENIEALRSKSIDLNGKEDLAAKFVDPKIIDYNDTWEKIEEMLGKIMGAEYRDLLTDSFGNGWVYNWFCLDLVYFEENPRRKQTGYHSVHDRYVEYLNRFNSAQDGIQWHFHPMSTYREAHKFATSYAHSPHLYEVLAKRIIDRNFFPSSFRPGFHVERPDSHWFLEQWIPFDLGNQSVEDYSEKQNLGNLKNGRLGDWRNAPYDWSIYNPDHDDYRKPGNCRRYIGRCLNMNARHSNLTLEEVDRAFARANTGKPTLMAMTNHDFRDMEPEIDNIRDMISKVSSKYPEVKFKFSEVTEAFQSTLFDGDIQDLKLNVELYEEDGKLRLKVNEEIGKVFGPQPFLAIKMKSGRYLQDNFDFSVEGDTWHYVFDTHTVFPHDIDTIGVAANNRFGSTFVHTLKP